MNGRSKYPRGETRKARRWAWLDKVQSSQSFWILSALLVLVLLTGGNARADAPLLFILRPTAVIIVAYGLMSMRVEQWRDYRYLLVFSGIVVMLPILQLVPLPPALWHMAPGHELARMIDQTIGTPTQWRPLSLVPSGTLNALYASIVPLAALLMAVQLTTNERVRLVYVLLAISSVSMVTGLVQSAGVPFNLYYPTDPSAAVEAVGLFANRNHQAALLAAMLPMLAAASRLNSGTMSSARAVTAIAVGIAALILPLLIVTGSRAGLGLGIVAVVLAMFYGLLPENGFRHMSARYQMRLKVLVGVVFLGLSGLVTFLSARGLAFTRLENMESELRPEVWLGTVKIVSHYLPWGSGIGSFVEVYSIHEPLGQLREIYFNHAHNDYLEIALTAGIPGLLLLAIAAFCTMRAIWRAKSGTSPASVLARLGGAIFIVLACASAADYPLRTPMLAVLLAIAASWLFAREPDELQLASSTYEEL